MPIKCKAKKKTKSQDTHEWQQKGINKVEGKVRDRSLRRNNKMWTKYPQHPQRKQKIRLNIARPPSRLTKDTVRQSYAFRHNSPLTKFRPLCTSNTMIRNINNCPSEIRGNKLEKENEALKQTPL